MTHEAGQGASWDALLQARYGQDGPQGTSGNGTLRLLLSHRSVRRFRPDPLPGGTLETLVAAAQSAATSSNLQAWSVVAVEDAARRARLAQLSGGQGFIAQAPLFLCWLADLSRLARVGAAQGREMAGLDHLEAFMVALADASLAAQNAAIAAESLGLGCVYVGALRNDPVAVAAELALPPRCVAVFGLAVGHPDPARPAAVKPRLPQDVVLHREQYGHQGEAARIAEYDTTLGAFSRGQGMAAEGWTGRVTDRIGDPAALRGRDRMRDFLIALGFPLR